ncbi:hypothetical protein Tco_1208481 [Tanacetum coccineum]
MGNEELSTIPEKESDKFIKSSVEELIPIPRESEDTSGSDSESVLPSSDNFSPIFEEKSMSFSNPLFEFDDEYISNDVNPFFDKVLENIKSKDSFFSNLDEPALLVTPLFDAYKDECFDPGGVIDEINAFLDMDISTDIVRTHIRCCKPSKGPRYKGLKTKQKRYTRYYSKYEVDWYEEGSEGTHVVHLLVDLKYSSLVAAVSPRSIYEAMG